MEQVLSLIWTRWNGIKHVWESSGWPFAERPDLNDAIALGRECKILLLARRNLLRRVVSNHVCRQTRYWMGDRAEFRKRLEGIELKPLHPDAVLRWMKQDREAVTRYLDLLSARSVPVLPLYYEDLFQEQIDEASSHEWVSRIVNFLGYSAVPRNDFICEWWRHFDPEANRWASAEIYRRIPGIEQIEAEAGSDATGWLFR